MPVVVLKTKSDWGPWFDRVKRLAELKRIWQYIDPDGTEELEMPMEPLFSEYHEGATKWEDLPPDKEKSFNFAWEMYTYELARWMRLDSAIDAVITFIDDTIIAHAWILLSKAYTTREVLKILRANYGFQATARLGEVGSKRLHSRKLC